MTEAWTRDTWLMGNLVGVGLSTLLRSHGIKAWKARRCAIRLIYRFIGTFSVRRRWLPGRPGFTDGAGGVVRFCLKELIPVLYRHIDAALYDIYPPLVPRASSDSPARR